MFRLGTVLLASIGMVDLVTTVYWLSIGGREGNQFFARAWETSPLQFVVLKLILLFGPISLIEYVRKRAPKSAEQGTWVAFGFYLLLWGGHALALVATLTRR